MAEKPFKFGRLSSPDYFTNRTTEIKSLSNNFISGTNTILISPRRWGKSSLVWNTSLRLKRTHKNIRFCFVDLFNIRTEEEFYEVYASELIKSLSSKFEEQVSGARQFFKNIIPQLSVPVDPQHSLSLNFEWMQLKRRPDEIIDLAENMCREKKIELIVCIDEFQNVGFFANPLAFQKKLRSHWQKHQLATYCIYGSKRNMMAHIFENPSMPFYKFGDVHFLKKIDRSHWEIFIVTRFEKTGKSITKELAGRIALLMEDHPYFVQQFALMVWQNSGKKCLTTDIDEALENLLIQMSILYQRETDLLSNGQINFLKALCNDETRFTSHEVLQRYRLSSSANVVKVKRALEQKEIIDTMEPVIEFTDPLYKTWFKRYMMQGLQPS
ncbi:MAG: hypothetical protein ABI723_17140 [Bacteroidia bacterium]